MADGNVEKSRQRRSRHFAGPSGSQTWRVAPLALTYYEYAPRVKRAAALLDGLF